MLRRSLSSREGAESLPEVFDGPTVEHSHRLYSRVVETLARLLNDGFVGGVNDFFATSRRSYAFNALVFSDDAVLNHRAEVFFKGSGGL